jgi:hypothetical protein
MSSNSGSYSSSNTAIAKSQEEAEDKNNLAMSYFTMAFMSAQLMGMIDSTTSEK